MRGSDSMRILKTIVAALAVVTVPAVTAADRTYPIKPIHLIVPYALGGLDASSEQGSRLRDATVRESAAAAGMIAQASISIVKYPVRPIRLIVPYAPGGGNDTMARAIGAKLTAANGISR